MTAREELLAEIRAFCHRHDMPVTTFGRLACNNTALVHRMERGRNVRIDVAQSIRIFMECYRPLKRRAGNASVAA